MSGQWFSLTMFSRVLLLISIVTSPLFSHPCEPDTDDDSFVHPEDQYAMLAPECCQYLSGLSETLSAFVACTVWNAKPFRVCQKCLNEYQNVTKASDALYDDTTNYNGSTCSDQLLSSDKEAVIYKVLTDSQKIWSISQCDKCYDTSTKGSTVMSNDTQHFFHLTKLVFNCFSLEEQEAGNVCKQCKQFYRNLNTFYASLGKTSSDICMDIVESMNNTRQAWSSTFNCLVQYEDTLAVAFTLACICLLPIFLYGGTAILETKYQNEVLKRKSNMYEEIGGHSHGSSDNQAYSPSYEYMDSAYSEENPHVLPVNTIPPLDRPGPSRGMLDDSSGNTRSLIDINEQSSLNQTT